ncbi:hypothetical protein [Escherichia coli]|uniref:hypothetical protein n=1 Tax=Escherichia coli TaxID=562 RepID=UPI000985410F|nr:hypothetical protein [Escherichia coli]EFW7501608.1 hypothetical protein [Shigella sonnei]EEV5753594.1 hypothetical protein [Escherichia coli]EEV9074571.1 hypothetical protein [Escherichia coli]EEV9389894.1 hypothetical protein [Escherichia coli]EEV9401346.1 hypothetical protein [Escherichia coli]
MKKLKSQYKKVSIHTYGLRSWCWYPNLRSHHHKHFSTYQEKRFYALHGIEYRDFPLKLRAARGSCLPDPWDDLPAYTMKVAKSWKHNSRRRYQYFRE